MPLTTLDEYLAVVEAIFVNAVAADAVCLKSTQAYQRTLRYEQVPKERAAQIFGKPAAQLSPAEIKDFEDFMFWHILELSTSTICRFKSIPATGGCKDRARCCCWTPSPRNRKDQVRAVSRRLSLGR